MKYSWIINICAYLILILLTSVIFWCIYNSFIDDVNSKVSSKTEPYEKQISEIKKLQASNPESKEALLSYDRINKTNFYGLGDNIESESYKATLDNKPEKIVAADQSSITQIKDRSILLDLPSPITILLAGVGIFLTTLITNFGNYCANLIGKFCTWLVRLFRTCAE